MPRYQYEALNGDGVMLNGALVADGEREALRVLERRGLTALRLQVDTAVFSASPLRRRRLTTPDLTVAFYELCIMLNADVALAEAVAAQGRSAHHPQVVAAFAGMATALQRGQSFSDALAASGLPLPDYMLQLARAGEMTGRLGESLGGGVTQMEYEYQVRSDLRNALIYPTILVLAGLAAVLVMFTYVVPKFSSLLQKSDQLPWLGWVVLAGGTWVNANRLWLGPALLLSGVGIVLALRQREVRRRLFDRLGRAPLIGPGLVESETARWAKMKGTLLLARVPLMRALELARDGMQLSAQRARMGEVTRAVRGGTPLSQALEDQDALTGTGYNLVRVGEKSGQLAAMLHSLAKLYDDAGRTRMKRLLALIEPLAILIIGLMVGLIIMGVMLAITSSYNLAV